jgi:MFS family permease
MPMYGQLANVFGRRWPLIISGLTFMLGSGICGG